MAEKESNWESQSDEQRIKTFKLSGPEEMKQMKEIFDTVYCPAKYGKLDKLKKGETQQLLCVCSQIGAGKSYTIRMLRQNLQKEYGNSIVEIDTDSCKPFTPKYVAGRKADMEARARGETYTGENYTRSSAPQSDYLKQIALDEQGVSRRNHVLYEFAVRDSSKEKIFESLRSFKNGKDGSKTDKRAVILAVPGVVSATSIFKRAENDYYDNTKVYIPAEINVHDESYAQMPAAIDEAFKRKYFDNVVITDREGRIHFDSSEQKNRNSIDLVKEIDQARDTYFIAHPKWKEEINAEWAAIFKSMNERNAPEKERTVAETVHKRVVKEIVEIEKRLEPNGMPKRASLDDFVVKTRAESLRNIR